jgi:cell division protein ZipA
LPGLQAATSERIIAVRLMSRERAGFPGEALVLALREAGLRHGQFGIFHRHDAAAESRILFSVASLVEPGSFDLSQLKNRHYPGISLFLVLPGAGDRLVAFDDMMGTARTLAAALDGELLDEQGSRLSVQRERYLREEVIQFRAERTAH